MDLKVQRALNKFLAIDLSICAQEKRALNKCTLLTPIKYLNEVEGFLLDTQLGCPLLQVYT
jgi:hypothetical protein